MSFVRMDADELPCAAKALAFLSDGAKEATEVFSGEYVFARLAPDEASEEEGGEEIKHKAGGEAQGKSSVCCGFNDDLHRLLHKHADGIAVLRGDLDEVAHHAGLDHVEDLFKIETADGAAA